MLRHYWIPVLFSSELAESDGPPRRVRVLGEDLIAFRATDGTVGLLGALCPHRRADLYFGRNEGQGLRCIYHGWKFDTAGHCIDMPNEPLESSFKSKIRHVAYPCMETAGIIFAYLGTGDPPAAPALELFEVPEANRFMTRRYQECNWVQALEGDFDSSHVGFLHRTFEIKSSRDRTESFGRVSRDTVPLIEAVEADCGLLSAARRVPDDDHYYWRISTLIMPFYAAISPYGDGPIRVNGWVPIDDESTMVWVMDYHPKRPITDLERGEMKSGIYGHIGEEDLLPPTSEYGGNWKSASNLRNDYHRSYERQRTHNFTGIKSFWRQDRAVTESMGRICDRSQEHLGPADIAIIRLRKLLLKSAEDVAHGRLPPALDPVAQRVRPVDMVLDRDVSWLEGCKRALYPASEDLAENA